MTAGHVHVLSVVLSGFGVNMIRECYTWHIFTSVFVYVQRWLQNSLRSVYISASWGMTSPLTPLF